MTDPIETPETPDQVVGSDNMVGQPEDADTGNPETEAPKGNREARYRTERNEYREQVATLSARIEQLHQLDIERLASETLSAPVDFWLSGNDVASYLDDQGNVDIHRVREDARLLVSERPGLSKYQPAVDRSQGSGNVTPGGKGTPTFSDLLNS